MITPKECELLTLFGKMTTPSAGGYHPLDMERWGDFVFLVYKNTKRRKPIPSPTPDDLMSVLGKYQFNKQNIQQLYDMMIDDLVVISRCWWPR